MANATRLSQGSQSGRNPSGKSCGDKRSTGETWAGMGLAGFGESEYFGRLGYEQPPKNIMAGRGARPFGERRNWFRVFSGVTCFISLH